MVRCPTLGISELHSSTSRLPSLLQTCVRLSSYLGIFVHRCHCSKPSRGWQDFQEGRAEADARSRQAHHRSAVPGPRSFLLPFESPLRVPVPDNPARHTTRYTLFCAMLVPAHFRVSPHVLPFRTRFPPSCLLLLPASLDSTRPSVWSDHMVA